MDHTKEQEEDDENVCVSVCACISYIQDENTCTCIYKGKRVICIYIPWVIPRAIYIYIYIYLYLYLFKRICMYNT